MSESEPRPEEERPKSCWRICRCRPMRRHSFSVASLFSTLTAAYLAREIVCQIFAVIVNLLLQPALRALERLRVPRVLGALLLILFVIATMSDLAPPSPGPPKHG